MKLGFIGTGNMAGAIMGGIIKNEIFKPEEIIGADISGAGRQRAKETYGIHVTDDNKKAAFLQSGRFIWGHSILYSIGF